MKTWLLILLTAFALPCFGQWDIGGPWCNFVPATAGGGGGGGSGAPGVESAWSTNFTGGGTVQFKFAIGASAANRVLLISIGAGDETWDFPAIVNINGTSITNNTLWNTNNANWVMTQSFYMIAPPTGNITNDVKFSNPKTQLQIGAVVLTNAAQTGTFGTAMANKGTSTTPTITVSSTASTAIVYSACTTDSQNSLTNSASATLQWVERNVASDSDAGGETLPGSASVVASWTTLATEDDWVIGAVSINGP